MAVIAGFVVREMKGCAIDWGDYVAVVGVFIARETQGRAIDWGDYMSVIAEFIARETQDFASLQAGAVIIINSKCVLYFAGNPK